jgi:O-antigen/teichoic acid export membrane protein
LEKSITSRAAAITFIDQVILSALNFAIGMAFIYTSTPVQYGLYTFMIAIFYFFASVQNAMVNTPMMVLLPRLGCIEKKHFIKGLTGLLSVGIPCAGIIILLIAYGFSTFRGTQDFSLNHAVIFTVSIWPLMLRDYWRAKEYANLRPALALRRDITYSLLALSMLVLLIIFNAVYFGTVLPIMGVSAFISFFYCQLEGLHPLPSWHEIQQSFRKAWPYSRWSLLGIASRSIQNNAYVYLPFFMLGIKEVAYLAAARLVMMPGTLLSTSWANYFKPLASESLAKGEIRGAFRTLITSTATLVVLLILYTGTVLIFLKVLPETWLPRNYQNISIYVLLWAGIMLITIMQSNISVLFQASLAFKKLALLGLLSAIFTFLISSLLIIKLRALGALVGLGLGEVFFTICLILNMRDVLLPKASHIDKDR